MMLNSDNTKRTAQYCIVTTDCYNIEFNSKIFLGQFFEDSRYDEVISKVKELETEGII